MDTARLRLRLAAKRGLCVNSTWDLLAVRLEALIQRWDAGGEPPALAEFLPDNAPALRRLTLTELIKVDLEYRWASGRPRRIEEYASEFPELLGPSGVPCDLIFEEFQVRRRTGEDVSPGEYANRFPAQAAELRRLIGDTDGGDANQDRRARDVEAGQQLDDFDLLAMLGEGAFARVFLARQRSLQRLVALKVSADRGTETQTLAQLDHPHIVRVYDQRVLPERGLRLLYMPYLPGGTLQSMFCSGSVKRPSEKRSGKFLLEAVDADSRAAARSRRPIPAIASASPTMSWPEAVCWLGARLADALRLRPPARRAAPRHQTGQRTARGRRRAAAGRLQREFLLAKSKGPSPRRTSAAASHTCRRNSWRRSIRRIRDCPKASTAAPISFHWP